MKRLWALALATIALCGCASSNPLSGLDAASPRISAERIKRHVALLASDAFGGRAPGTAGETKTVAYLSEQFKAVGLAPGYRGSWFQDVPLMRAEPALSATLTISDGSGARQVLKQYRDVLLVSGRWEPKVVIDRSDILFVGYGISAPDLKHDDYAGVDVRGRTLLMLPWTPDRPAFAGNARFQYGSPQQKAAEAARRGAAAVLIVVPDGEGWQQSVSAVRSRMLGTASAAPPKGPALDGRIKRSVVERLLAGGPSLDQLERQAALPDFRPVPLSLTVSTILQSEIRRFNSRNVVGILRGTDRPNEHIVFVAHWDAYGKCPPSESGDGICNGALDNASGVGSLIELARAFASRGPLRRSILFLAATAEEQGLIGSTHYASNPALPLADAVGGVALDMTAGRERGADVVLFGKGLSELDPYLEAAAALQGRRIAAPRPGDANYFERSDNMAFVRKGVPVLSLSGLWAEGSGREALDLYFERHYHGPTDEFALIRSFEGAAEDAELLHHFGRALAETSDWPAWREGSPYTRLRAPRTPSKNGD
jgi:hypothetical protein